MIDLLIINPGSKSNYEGMHDLKAIEPPVWAGMIAYEFRKKGGNVLVLDANAMELDHVRGSEDGYTRLGSGFHRRRR